MREGSIPSGQAGSGSSCHDETGRTAVEPAGQRASGVIQGAPPWAYSPEDQAFHRFWYGHMQDDLMQPPLAGVSHATARYIWDAAIAEAARDVRELLWGLHPECCGSPDVGAEYMGQKEMVCCGCPDFDLLNDAQIVATLRAKFPEPRIPGQGCGVLDGAWECVCGQCPTATGALASSASGSPASFQRPDEQKRSGDAQGDPL